MSLFGVNEKKIEQAFLRNSELLIGQGRLPSSSLIALDNSSFARTEKELRIKLSESQKWNLFTKLVEDMQLSIEDELLQVNNFTVKEIAQNCIIKLSEISDKRRFTFSIMPKNSIGNIVLSNPSLHRGKKMEFLFSKFYELEKINDVKSLKEWAQVVGKTGLK